MTRPSFRNVDVVDSGDTSAWVSSNPVQLKKQSVADVRKFMKGSADTSRVTLMQATISVTVKQRSQRHILEGLLVLKRVTLQLHPNHTIAGITFDAEGHRQNHL